MAETQSISRLFCLYVIQGLIPTFLVVATSKRSPVRYLAIPCMLYVVSLMLYAVERPSFMAVTFGGGGVMHITSALDVLLINPKDGSDFVDASGKIENIFTRLRKAVGLMTDSRKIGTPRQAKNIPPPPKYYKSGAANAIPRGQYLIRETAIALWLYLVLDILTVQGTQTALEKKEQAMLGSAEPTASSAELWAERLITALVIWFIVTRSLMSFYHRVVSVPSVALGFATPETFPPLFNRMADAYTLRNFWGKFWHQNLRVNFTAVSTFMTRDVLGLPKPSVLERYTNVFLVFCLSGALHIVTDVIIHVPIRESHFFTFFVSFTFGYMVEDGVQAAWKKLFGSSNDDEEPGMWKKAVGFVWVVTYLTIASTWLLEPLLKRPESQMAMVPWSVTEIIGLDIAGAMAVGSGVILKFVFQGEL